MFNLAEKAACERLLTLAVAEDLGLVGDRTSQMVIPTDLEGQAYFVARSPGVLAGLPAADLVFHSIAATVKFETLAPDASQISPGDRIARVTGPMRGILAAERTALNFLQHLSGIATLTRRFVDAIAGCKATILDTRKTLPGWRLLAKYAVRQGGGSNHRMGLYDGILIKDNHLATLAKAGKELTLDRQLNLPIEIEVDSLAQLEKMLPLNPDIVLLDNMSTDQMREAVALRDRVAPKVNLEASGGVTLVTVRAIAETGVDRISVGALTHSANALDIALDYA